jgi:hypothetical protein
MTRRIAYYQVAPDGHKAHFSPLRDGEFSAT